MVHDDKSLFDANEFYEFFFSEMIDRGYSITQDETRIITEIVMDYLIDYCDAEEVD